MLMEVQLESRKHTKAFNNTICMQNASVTEDTVKSTLLFLEKTVINRGDMMKNYVISRKEENRNV
jgi:hypothetical protein